MRDSVKDAIGKITGNAELRSDGAGEKSVGEEGTPDGGMDQPVQVPTPR